MSYAALAVILFLSINCISAQTIKVGVLAPEGTSWSINLKKMAKEISEATDGKVKIKYYFGGAQGDEPDVLRKIRIDQLQGGIFTGKTLGDINGDVRVIEIPFSFNHDRKKAWNAVEGMGPYFNKTFEQKKFKNLGFFEIGLVYFVSQREVDNLDALKGIKIWSWEGDLLVSTMTGIMNLVTVPLPLPDVLSSLTTGIIEAAYAPPLGIVSLQWNTKIKYIVDFPISFSLGAFLLSENAWNKIDPSFRTKIEEISNRYVENVNKANELDNQEALRVMKEMGVKFVRFPDEDIKKGSELRAEIIKTLSDKLFSKEAIRMLEKYF